MRAEKEKVRQDGGWMFVSYANEDIAQVRQIRNTLEENGFKPILFYLKCMEEKTDDRELKSLIHREIEARQWFVLLDSPSARESEWVQDEVAHVLKFPKKKIFTVDLSENIDGQVKEIMGCTRVFLSYDHRDSELKERLFRKLMKTDFLVWEDSRIEPWAEWEREIVTNLQRACAEGFVLLLITENFIDNPNCSAELHFAAKQEGQIVPVVVGEVELSLSLEYMLADKSWIRISADPSEEELDRVVQMLVEFFDH